MYEATTMVSSKIGQVERFIAIATPHVGSIADCESNQDDMRNIEVGMRELDKDVISFMHEEDDESELLQIKRKAFEESKDEIKTGPYDYLKTRGMLKDQNKTDNNSNFLSSGIHDDTRIDLVKVMNRFQEDREVEEQYQKQLDDKFNNF